MATKEALDDSETQNNVDHQHLDKIPQRGISYLQPDFVPRQGTEFRSFHDSDSDLLDYELRSMSSFLGADLDKSDADSWDWTFHDENVSDLDIKKVPELAKTEKLLMNINEELPFETVKMELVKNSRIEDGQIKCLESANTDARNTEQLNNTECYRSCIFEGSEATKRHTNESTSYLQREENEQIIASNSHKKHIHLNFSSYSKDSSACHIQRNNSETCISNVDDDFIYFADDKSSKVFKIRLQYLSNNATVGRRPREKGGDKFRRITRNTGLRPLKLSNRSSENTHFETQNNATNLTKLINTEARFIYSGSTVANNVHSRTMPSQSKQTTSFQPSSQSEPLLPPINGKRVRPFLDKRDSSYDLLAERITSWRLNRGWAMSKQDVLGKRLTKEEERADRVGFGGSRGRHSWVADTGLDRFRHVVRMVLILLRAVGRRREKREDANYNFLSWTVVYDEVLGISRLNYDRGALTFDPLLFKANRESTLSQDIKDILRLPPEQRTEANIRTVMISFHNVVPSFSEYPKEIQQSMIKVCMYEKFESGRVIIRQGHRAENFYFIIGGSAVVTQMDSEAGHVHTTNVLGRGNSFGELAFLHMSKRSATVTCRDDVELLCIEREDFINIFMRPRKGDEPDHIKFLKSVDLLQGWPVSLLPHVNPKICAFTYVRRGVILCHDNANSDWIFVVYSGSCKVLKALEDRPVPGLDGRAHKISLTPDVHNIPKVNRRSPSTVSKENSHMHGRNHQGDSCRRLRKYGVSLPPIRSAIDGLANENCSKASVSDADHLQQLTDIFNHRHVLPTIDGNNRTDQENNQQTSAKVASSETDSTFRLKPQSPGVQPLTLSQPGASSDETTTTQQPPLRKFAFVEIARLEPGDVFGLDHVVLSGMRNVASCSLVSQGAEVVLISKSFFKKHLTEDTLKRMRQLIQPLPSEKALLKKFQKKKEWDVYKSQTLARHNLQRLVHGAAP